MSNVHVQVTKYDENSKICQQCFCNVNKYLHYRESCVAENMYFLLRQASMEKHNADVIPTGVDVGAISEPVITYEISSDSDNSCEEVSVCQWKNFRSNLAESVIRITKTDTDSEDEEIDVGSPTLETYAGDFVAPPMENVNRIRFNNRKNANFMMQCTYGNCKEMFENVDAMTYHVTSYHRKGIDITFVCYLCKRKLSKKNALPSHMNALHCHADVDGYLCPLKNCAIKFHRRYALENHVKTVHVRKIVFGDEGDEHCNRYFLFQCKRCNDFFEFSDELMYHLVVSHIRGNPKKFECYLCKFKPKKRQALQNHINVQHIRPAHLMCSFPTCTTIFYYESTLRDHIKALHVRIIDPPPSKKKEPLSASDNALIRCPKGCLKNVFENVDAKTHHIETYHADGIRNTFECHLCQKKFKKVSVLRFHIIKRHCNQSRLMCPFPKCARTFISKYTLKLHIQRLHFDKVGTKNNKIILGFGDIVISQENGQCMVECTEKSCKDVFGSWQAMMYHRSTFHANGVKNTFECHLCKKPLSSKYKLREHIYTVHAGRKRFQCPSANCCEKFTRKESMQKHFRSNHGPVLVH